MHNQKVLITGTTGMLGRHFLEVFQEKYESLECPVCFCYCLACVKGALGLPPMLLQRQFPREGGLP